MDTVADYLPAGSLRSLVSELAVEPPRHKLDAVNAQYAGAILAGMAATGGGQRTSANLRSAMQRAEAAGDSESVLELHADLVGGGQLPACAGRPGTGDDDALMAAVCPGGAGRCRRRSPRAGCRRNTSRRSPTCADGKLLAASRFGLWVIEDGQASRLGWESVAKAG